MITIAGPFIRLVGHGQEALPDTTDIIEIHLQMHNIPIQIGDFFRDGHEFSIVAVHIAL